jgi:hypothetical protein
MHLRFMVMIFIALLSAAPAAQPADNAAEEAPAASVEKARQEAKELKEKLKKSFGAMRKTLLTGSGNSASNRMSLFSTQLNRSNEVHLPD